MLLTNSVVVKVGGEGLMSHIFHAHYLFLVLIVDINKRRVHHT